MCCPSNQLCSPILESLSPSFCNMHSLSHMKSHRPTFSSSPLVVVHTNALFISTQNNAGSHTHTHFALTFQRLKPEQCGVTERQRDRTGERRVTEEDRLCLRPFGSHRKKKQLNVGLCNLSLPWAAQRKSQHCALWETGMDGTNKNVSVNWIKMVNTYDRFGYANMLMMDLLWRAKDTFPASLHYTICMIYDAFPLNNKIIVYLMSPNFLVMALPSVLKAAEVFCPAVDSVSDVFLYLRHKEEGACKIRAAAITRLVVNY